MPINVVVFGSLTDIMNGLLALENIDDTDTLIKELQKRYPDLQHSKYIIAVNKKMIGSNTKLSPDDTVALMSPFSGG